MRFGKNTETNQFKTLLAKMNVNTTMEDSIKNKFISGKEKVPEKYQAKINHTKK